MSDVVNINDVLDGHVALEVECVDRLYLNAYVPNLQVGPQVNQFLERHLGYSIGSPALIQQIGTRFRREVKAFAARHRIPILQLKKPDRSRWDDRKLDHVRPYLERAERAGRCGVVAIIAAQEFQWVFSATKHTGSTTGGIYFRWAKEERRVGVYYFYVLDREFGPGLHQDLHLLPVSGQGVDQRPRVGQASGPPGRIAFTELANGFASCAHPDRLQAICDRFGPADVQAFFDRWITAIPTPLTDVDRAAGYWWELSMRQVEVSRTLVFDDPRRARSFFEALVADNVGIGRPHEMAMVFARPLRRPTKHPYRTQGLRARHRRAASTSPTSIPASSST